MENTQESKTTRFSAALITTIIVVRLITGGLLGYSIGNSSMNTQGVM